MTVEKLVDVIKHQKIVMNSINRMAKEPIKISDKFVSVAWKNDTDPVAFRQNIEKIGNELVSSSFFSRSNDDSPGVVFFLLGTQGKVA